MLLLKGNYAFYLMPIFFFLGGVTTETLIVKIDLNPLGTQEDKSETQSGTGTSERLRSQLSNST